jgi:NAD(P)-dependent dehydrogenase (short-subunit alcohol dehydrogenase family)
VCELKGKVVIVTGGAGLLGGEFVKAIMENAGTAIIADVDERAGKKSLDKIKKVVRDGSAEFVRVDINSKASIQSMLSYLVNKYKKIDALVNSAYPKNKNYGAKFEEVTYEDFCENVNLHLGGYFLVSQQLALFFKKQSYGNIINIASIYGVIAPRFEIYKSATLKGREMTVPVEYAAAKSAIIHLTRYMAKYFKGCNIRINSISPGGIFNNQLAGFVKRYNDFGLSKGMLDVSDLNSTLLYLLCDKSGAVSGQNIIVDDGWTL